MDDTNHQKYNYKHQEKMDKLVTWLPNYLNNEMNLAQSLLVQDIKDKKMLLDKKNNKEF